MLQSGNCLVARAAGVVHQWHYAGRPKMSVAVEHFGDAFYRTSYAWVLIGTLEFRILGGKE